jgi:3-deoxy-manno-octulosonate cytidylyltransferase (CMP-KDO synthetase)
MSTLDRVVVATDSDRVAAVCRKVGAPVEMTRDDHPSGTDRVAEVVRRDGFTEHEIVVNIQGDEPLLKEEHLRAAVGLVRAGWEIGTCATPLATLEARKDPNVVKVVRGRHGGALYFSRAGIPYKRDGKPDDDDLTSGAFLRHIGIYAYRRDALLRWVDLPPSPLEKLEMLEQLRPLEAGMGIGVAVVDAASAGVDTPADAVVMERRLKELGLDTLNEVSGAR